MATDRAQDLQAFKNFIEQQLASGRVPTVAEALALWDHVNQNLEQPDHPELNAASLQAKPDEWARQLRAWVASQPRRTVTMDDSRESIYSGRGE